MKKKKLFIVLAVLAVLGGIGGYVGYKMWNQPHRDINEAKADFQSTASDLAGEFQKGGPASDKKYHEKVVSLKGTIAEIVPGAQIDEAIT